MDAVRVGQGQLVDTVAKLGRQVEERKAFRLLGQCLRLSLFGFFSTGASPMLLGSSMSDVVRLSLLRFQPAPIAVVSDALDILMVEIGGIRCDVVWCVESVALERLFLFIPSSQRVF